MEWTSHLSSATTTSTTMADKLIVCASKHQALFDKCRQIIESIDIMQEHFYIFIFSRCFFSIWWAVHTDSTNDLCEYNECHLCAQREDITLKKRTNDTIYGYVSCPACLGEIIHENGIKESGERFKSSKIEVLRSEIKKRRAVTFSSISSGIKGLAEGKGWGKKVLLMLCHPWVIGLMSPK